MVNALHRRFCNSPNVCTGYIYWPFEPEINRLRRKVEYYYLAKFHVILIMGFRFYRGKNAPMCDKHIHTYIVTK